MIFLVSKCTRQISKNDEFDTKSNIQNRIYFVQNLIPYYTKLSYHFIKVMERNFTLIK